MRVSVSAIVLLLLSALAAAQGVLSYSSAETIMQQMAALLFGVMAAVGIGSAAIVSAVKQVAIGMAAQVKALEAKQSAASTGDGEAVAHLRTMTPPAPRSRYRVTGIDAATGMETTLVVEAEDQDDAKARASRKGVKAESIKVGG